MDVENLKNDIAVDGPETIGFLTTKNEKISSFPETNNFSGKAIPRNMGTVTKKDAEETEKFINGKTFDSNDEHLHGDTGSGSESGNGNKIKQQKQYTGWKRYLGMGLAIFSSSAFALGILIVKVFKDYHTFNVGIWRFQGLLIPSIPLMLHALCVKKQKIFEPIHPVCELGKFKMFFFLFLRAFGGCGAVLFHFYSLQYMTVSDATVIALSTPVFVTFLAYLILGEQCGVINVVSAVVTLIGVTVITRPPFLTGEKEMDSDLLTGVGLALGSMLFSTSMVLILRVLKGVHYSIVTFFFGMYGTIVCVILSIVFVGSIAIPQNQWDWFLAIVLAALTFVGQVCYTLALKYEEAGPISLCRTFDIIFAIIWQFIFLNVIPDAFSFIGTFIILTGVLLAGFRKYLSMLPEKHSRRKTFWFILK